MTIRFPNSLRVRPGVVTVGGASVGPHVMFRVESPAVWDVVLVDAHGSDSVRSAKLCALDALLPDALFPDDFSVKLGGCEIFDESQSLTDVGVANGSTLLVTQRRRRPVR